MGGRSRNSRKKYRKTKPQRILIRCGFLVGAGGLKEPGSRLPAAASCLGRHAHPAGRSPNSSSLFLPLAAVVAAAQGLFSPPDCSAGRCCSNPPLSPLCKCDKTETPVPIGYRSSWWARVDCASRAAKNSPLGCFCAVFCDSAAAVRIHPLYEFNPVTKQKPQRTCIR